MEHEVLRSPRSPSRVWAIRANRWAYRISRYWLVGFSLIFGLYVSLPFLAPVLMNLGYEAPARIIYTIYSFLCHQLPQRSFFLFSQQITYPLTDIQSAWHDTNDMMILRQFIGTPAMGWKVAWSDRMVSMYTSILVFAWIWYPLRKQIPRLHWQGFFLLIFPMVIDGLSHFTSDLAGMGQGFRESNAWLATLTNHAFSPTFYTGDGWGSFNSLMRMLTGILFGAGIVWFGFPYLGNFFADMKLLIEEKFQRADLSL